MKDYIVIDGNKYRVEVNWNAIIAFCEFKGVEDLSALGDIVNMKPRELSVLMHYAIREGEAADGKECNLSAEDIARNCRMKEISDFLNIYKKQAFSGKEEAAESAPAEKKRRIIFR